MSAGDSAKADQIAFHVYTKLFHVLYAARASDQGPATGKTDKWFNLETPLIASMHTPTAELDAYRALSSLSPSPSSSSSLPSSPSTSSSAAKPLAIQVLLSVPPAGGGTALVHAPSRTRVEPEPRFVLLEEWVLAFASASTATSSSADRGGEGGRDADVLPPTIYKNAIPLFRALYALLRVLPAWR
ncbi:phosphorylated protein that interacts with Vac8p, partial [Mycena maculata]